MPSAITAIFGADSQPLQREMAKLEAVAGISGARMGSRFSQGFGHGGGAGGGISGIMRETLVIFRELGRGNLTRVPGSATLLFQYLGGLGLIIKSTAAESVKAAAADEKLAAKMAATAVAARDKAEASKAAVIASNLDGGASLRQALADNMSAKAAKENAEAQIVKAEASSRSASIQLASATTSLGPVGIIILGVVAALMALYAAYKVVHFFRNLSIQSEISEAQTALKLKLNYEEQAEALKKLADASEKTKDALARLNDVQNTSVKKSQDAVDAIKQQASAAKTLADAKTRGELLDVDLAEKSGAISHSEAIRKKADIEKGAVAASASAKLGELYDVMYAAGGSDVKGQAQAKADAAAAQAASDKLNTSPAGIKNATRLAQLEKVYKWNLEGADESEKNAMGMSPGSKKENELAYSRVKAKLAALTKDEIDRVKDKMHPDELAASAAMKKAEQSSSAAKQLAEAHSQAVTEYVNAKKTSGAEVSAEQSNIDKKERLDLMKTGSSGGFSLNSQQRIGAYATTPPDWSILLSNVKGIHDNTKHLAPQNQRVGSNRPQFGGASH